MSSDRSGVSASVLPAGAGADASRLVVFAPNWLGDAVMALPAIADVRRHNARATFVVAGRASVAPLFELVAGVDRVVTLGSSWSADPGALGRGQFDTAILLPNSFHSAFRAWRAGIGERWGYDTDLRGALLTRRIAVPAPGHHTHRYQQLVAALGMPTGPSVPVLEAPERVLHDARARMMASGRWDGRSPFVAIAPGAAYGGAKRWPAASFAAIADAVCRDGLVPVLIGGAADRQAGLEVAVAVSARTRNASVDLIGQTSLPELAGVLAMARVLVTNDSGAMHLATALGVRVVAIFGPTDERATQPLGRGPCEVVTHAVWCRPCLLRECPTDHRCMRGVTVERVAAAVGDAIAAGAAGVAGTIGQA